MQITLLTVLTVISAEIVVITGGIKMKIGVINYHMKTIITAITIFLLSALITRIYVLGFIPVYEIIGCIGSLCFVVCAFIIGFYAGHGKCNYDRDMAQTKRDVIMGRLK